MPHSYGLYPWTWNASESCHEPPQGAFAVLDMRPLSEQAVVGQSGGWGFFAWPDNIPGDGPNVAPPADLISLGYGDCRELQPTTDQRDELRIRLGLSSNPGGSTLIDTISDCLGALADPSGQNGPKPLLPTREGSLEIHLSNHSRVWQSAFDGGAMFATNATGRANRIRDVLRSDLETANKSGGPELVAKVLGHWCDRWGVSYSQAAKWRNLIRGPLLAELLSKTGGKFAPKKPATSYSDNFNRADASSLGAAWSIGFTAGGVTYEVNTNQARVFYDYPTAASGGTKVARYDSDLSSADHWADCSTVSDALSSNDRLGSAVRLSGSTYTTFYATGKTLVSGSATHYLYKYSSSSPTILASSSLTLAAGTVRTRANGSTISSEMPIGTSRYSVTDTSITGTTRCGMFSRRATSITVDLYHVFDDWSCDDGVSIGQPMALRTAGMRLGWARVGRGF